MDISSLNLNIFKPMLEESLNQKFNVSNLGVFLKYYTYHFESRFKEYNLDPTKIENQTRTPDLASRA